MGHSGILTTTFPSLTQFIISFALHSIRMEAHDIKRFVTPMLQEIHIRPATELDITAMAKVNVDTRKAMYGGFYPAHLLANMAYEKTEKTWHKMLWETPEPPGNFALVAENDARQIIGVLIGGPEKSGNTEYQGEIYVLYVLPKYHKQGIGKRLIAAAAKKLLAADINNMLIWVLADNPSRHFYEAIGGKMVHVKDIQVGDATLKEACYGWKDLHSLL